MLHAFWYKPYVSPPKDYAKWDDLITQFTKHLVDRYGIDEVSQWYFEVWNEPNLDFWGGDPKQPTYWELYDHTARAIKNVKSTPARRRSLDRAGRLGRRLHPTLRRESRSRRFRLLARLRQRQVTKTSSARTNVIPRDQMVCRAVKKVHDQIKASPRCPSCR